LKITNEEINKIIKKAIEKEFSTSKKVSKIIDKSGIGVIKCEEIEKIRLETGNSNDQVYVKKLFTLEESPRIGAGIMEITKSTFDWELVYDEIDYIIEGRLEIIIDDRKIVGEKGDVILIPRNSKIKFSAPEYSKFIYVVYPANWLEKN
jgi:ethanolamine utilization protein EutQ